MAENDGDFDAEGDTSDHSPDLGPPSAGHGYDAVFFIVSIFVALAFCVAIYYFKGY